MVITVEEYREILNDQASSEDLIKKRLQYLESFCRNVIKLELENYLKSHEQSQKTTP